MENLAQQSQFWDRSVASTVFSHPLDHARFLREVRTDAAVLDYGCGRGRLCGELAQRDFANVVGVDYSREMIETAKCEQPTLNVSVVDGSVLPFADESFDAVLLFAVLTCIASDAAQRELMAQISRVLKRGGLLLISDYPLQTDARNVDRYAVFAQEFGGYGTFRLPNGGVVRHHRREWFTDLLGGYSIRDEIDMDATTMNGNPARIVQIWARREA